MTRFWSSGLPIAVRLDASWTPAAVCWENRWHRIATVASRWRLDEGWWSERVWREYFLVLTEDKLLLFIFHDLRARRWYLQRVYD